MPVVMLLFAVLLATTPAHGEETGRPSGQILGVDPGRRTLTLDELGPWHPGTADRHRVVTLTPDTRAVLLSRAPGPAQDGWPGGFDRWLRAAAELRVGDYATVTVTRCHGHLAALSIAVVRPEGPPLTEPGPAPARDRLAGEPRRVD